MNEKLKKNLIIAVYVALILFFVTNSSIWMIHILITILTAITTSEFDIQLLIFFIMAILIMISFIYVFFKKMQDKIKILMLVIILILQIGYFKSSFYISSINKIINIEICTDKGGIWDKTNNICEMK